MSKADHSPEQQTDRLFATERQPEDFRFDAAVARVFPDMIRRSVPGYTTIIPMIEVITEQYAQAGSNCYDLGCSLGASTLAMRHGISFDSCSLVGVDNSEAMIERCEHYIALDDHSLPVSLRCENIQETARAANQPSEKNCRGHSTWWRADPFGKNPLRFRGRAGCSDAPPP